MTDTPTQHTAQPGPNHGRAPGALSLIKLYGIAMLVFLALDIPWLNSMTPALYQAELGHLMADDPNFIAALLFYVMYIAGCLYLVVLPSVSVKQAAIRGAVLGLIAYGTYDMTSLAVFKDWPVYVSVIDMVWGSFLTASVCLVSRSYWAKVAGADY